MRTGEALAERRKQPRDDLMSALLDAKIDGKGLSEGAPRTL
jgi:cytochrome P450